jgi:phosphoribosylanthranilate isomerase
VVWIKICGITRVEDAAVCARAGADAIGINFFEYSPRCCDEVVAKEIVDAFGKELVTVGVFVDADIDRITFLRDRTGIERMQLHGDEPPEMLERLQPGAYKALRVRGPSAVEQARRYGGDPLLLDAYVPGQSGGTGTAFDWRLAAPVSRERRVVLAGGLTPDNVARAIEQVRPFGVDVAGGVESAPGRKDPGRVRAFIAAARAAGEATSTAR